PRRRVPARGRAGRGGSGHGRDRIGRVEHGGQRSGNAAAGRPGRSAARTNGIAPGGNPDGGRNVRPSLSRDRDNTTWSKTHLNLRVGNGSIRVFHDTARPRRHL